MSTPLLVLSPHVGDAVLGCGQWLAATPGALVVTVFAAIPPGFAGVTDGDAACGFASSREAVDARQAEDDAALALLQARALRLPFCDAQDGDRVEVAPLAAALGEVIAQAQPAGLAFPLGLVHSDHRLLRAATLQALHRLAAPRTVLAYQEAHYRQLEDAVRQALAAIRAAPAFVGPVQERHAQRTLDAKRRALACYRSPLRGLPTLGRLGREDAFRPERYWPVMMAAAVAGERCATRIDSPRGLR